MIYVADQAGQPWKNDQKSYNPIVRGEVLARNEWSMLRTILIWVALISLGGAIVYYVIYIYLLSTTFGSTPYVLGQELLIGFFISCFIIIIAIITYTIIWRIPRYRFTVYDNGFTYIFKLPGTDLSSNYMPYTKIRSIYFNKYGLRMILVLNTNRRAMINSINYYPFPFLLSEDYRTYIILMTKLKNMFQSITFPDIQAIADYMEALDREASPESFYNEGMCRRDLEMKNNQFV